MGRDSGHRAEMLRVRSNKITTVQVSDNLKRQWRAEQKAVSPRNNHFITIGKAVTLYGWLLFHAPCEYDPIQVTCLETELQSACTQK